MKSSDFPVQGLSLRQAIIKRALDVSGALAGLALTWWLIVPAFIISTLDTGNPGFFVQTRIGRGGRPYRLVKLRTMRDGGAFSTHVTTDEDPRITRWGRFFRKTKMDELPQLINVLLGDMSLVGPRPDVPGYADRLAGEDRIILTVRPGITGPGTLAFRDEEALLARQEDPQRYNDEVVYPEKVRLNKEYVRNYSFRKDLSYIIKTLLG